LRVVRGQTTAQGEQSRISSLRIRISSLRVQDEVTSQTVERLRRQKGPRFSLI